MAHAIGPSFLPLKEHSHEIPIGRCGGRSCPRGGACRLRDQDLLILDRDQAPADQIEVLAEALRGRDLEQIYLSPAARRVLQTGPE